MIKYTIKNKIMLVVLYTLCYSCTIRAAEVSCWMTYDVVKQYSGKVQLLNRGYFGYAVYKITDNAQAQHFVPVNSCIIDGSVSEGNTPD